MDGIGIHDTRRLLDQTTGLAEADIDAPEATGRCSLSRAATVTRIAEDRDVEIATIEDAAEDGCVDELSD